jgi:hypothetical protein
LCELAPFGPPSASDRAERITEVVRRAGDSVRPPPPAPVATVGQGNPFGAGAERAMTTVHLPPTRQATRMAIVAALAGMACASAIFAIAPRLWPVAAASATAASPPRPSAMAAALVPSAAPEPPATASAEAVDHREAAASATASGRAKVGAPTKPHPVATPWMAPAKAASPSTNGSGDARRAQFGERE